MKEDSEATTCSLELKGGLNGINYPQKFVRAPSQGKHPCNYAAEKVNEGDVAMRMAMGK
jgi:hypothetical protein